jgi:hypothetical protein
MTDHDRQRAEFDNLAENAAARWYARARHEQHAHQLLDAALGRLTVEEVNAMTNEDIADVVKSVFDLALDPEERTKHLHDKGTDRLLADIGAERQPRTETWVGNELVSRRVG